LTLSFAINIIIGNKNRYKKKGGGRKAKKLNGLVGLCKKVNKLTKRRITMFSVNGKRLITVSLSLFVLFGVVSLSGCPTLAPMSSTKLEIGGDLVAGVLEAWNEDWYKFEVDKENTPLLLIFKNMGDADDAWLGYQINWYYKNKRDLVLLESIEVPPTGPANPNNIIIEDKARIFWVAPYKGTYQIRLYGYAQPVSENKKYQLPYMIGLAKPETYTDATEIAAGSVKEVNVVGDVISIFKLNASAGSIYRIRIEDTLSPDIVEPANTLEDIDVKIVRMDTDGDVTTVYNGKDALIDYTLATHSTDQNKYYLILENEYELGNVKVKITFEQISAGTLSASATANTITITGKEAKAYKLQVESGKTYTVTLQNTTGVTASLVKVESNGTQSQISPQFSVPNDNTNEYYLALKGIDESTSASVSVTFNTVT